MTSNLFSDNRLRQHLMRARSMDGGRYFLSNRFLYGAGLSSLMDRLSVIKRPMDHVLVLGCGIEDDAVGAALVGAGLALENITFLDPFYGPDKGKNPRWEKTGMLPVSPKTYDLVISFFGLSIAENVPILLRSIYESLKPDRPFLGVFLGGRTLMNFRFALENGELEICGGLSPRIHPMMAANDGFHLLESAGFALPIVDTTQIKAAYPTVSALIQDLRFHGITNSLSDYAPIIPPRRFWDNVGTHYPKNPDHGGIDATYELVFLNGWRP